MDLSEIENSIYHLDEAINSLRKIQIDTTVIEEEKFNLMNIQKDLENEIADIESEMSQTELAEREHEYRVIQGF